MRFVWLIVALMCAAAVQAQTWERLGPEGGIVVSLGAGTTGPVYLGTADGHVFASEDSGDSWQLRGRVGSRLDAVVTRLLVDSSDPKFVFAAVWYREAAESGGVFRSEDGGRTWGASGLEGEAVRALETAPSNHMELVAGTRTGVFRSTDQGKTWQRISPEGDPELRNVDSIAIDPRNADVLYAGTYHLPWRTKNGGKNWESILAGIIDDSDIMSMRLDSTNPDRLYMSACSGIYRSENQGGEWTKLQGIPYAARRTQTIVQGSNDPLVFYAGTTEGAWVSRDAGETWARTTPKDWVVNSILVLPERFKRGGRVIVGTESGVSISDDAGRTLAASNRGFTHVVVKQLLTSPEHGQHLLALVQRNGWELLESIDEAQNWTSVALTTAKPGKTLLSPDQIEEAYGSPWGWLLRMVDGKFWLRGEKTSSWGEWKPRVTPEVVRPKGQAQRKGMSQPALPLEIGKAAAFTGRSAIVSSNQGLLRCEESANCVRVKAFSSSHVPAAIWASEAGDRIAVVEDQKFGFSTDGGATAVWSEVPAGAKVLWIGETNASTHARFALGVSAGLLVSSDSGATWMAEKNGIPAGRIEAGLFTARYWLVSERTGGLYVSRDEGVSWVRIDQDDQRGRVAGLAGSSGNAIVVGSQSEGLLRWTAVEK